MDVWTQDLILEWSEPFITNGVIISEKSERKFFKDIPDIVFC